MRSSFLLVSLATVLAMGTTRSSGQVTDLKVSLTLESHIVSEHLPIALDIVVTNQSTREIEVFPYDVSRLPDVVIAIEVEGPLTIPKPVPGLVEGGFPDVKLRPSESVTLRDYLQTFVQHLAVGKYAIPYTLRWEYQLEGSHGKRRQFGVSGTLEFEVTPSDPAALQNYVAERIATVRQSTDIELKNRAAKETSFIDDPSVVPALLTLKDLGYEFEVLKASKSLPMPSAVRVLAAVADSSNNPGAVREAIHKLQDRGGKLPDDSVRRLLASENKWLQIEAISYIGSSHRRQFQSEITKLSESHDPDVSAAAQNAKRKLENN